MAFYLYNLYTLLPLLLLLFSSPCSATSNASKFNMSTYIVHTNNLMRPSHISTQADWYSFMFHSLTNQKSTPTIESRILYIYDTVLHGFAAKLTVQEAEKLAKMQGVINVYEDEKTIELHTTHTPDFLGLNINYGLWPETNFGDDVIIGLVDSGIWPESASFSDYGLEPIGPQWKGECEEGTQFNESYCNNKIIGARFFCKGMEANLGYQVEGDGEYRSPRDGSGHGTHTSSTAAGTSVAGVDMFGFASGNAQGIATNARISMYKACWRRQCVSSDILAAMDKAIQDGVNVLSISLGPMKEIPYYENPILIGAFAALKKRIFVACSAGNSGYTPYSVVNSAPWLTTVGAGSVDRTFPALVQLGNGEVLVGGSLYKEKVNGSSSFSLVYLGNCYSGDIVPDNVMGKIVLCDSSYDPVEAGFRVEEAGGVGLIGMNSENEGEGIIVKPFTLPALTLGYREGLKIHSYMNTTKNPTASFKLEGLTVVGNARAPMVASFSSRGPNSIVPQILKPDILAPGSNIIGAWVDDKAPTLLLDDPRRVRYNILSGTSMACPHVAGIAALLLKAHPTWSPAAIRSAMMTSSAIFDHDFRPILGDEDMGLATLLDFGAGHVHPQMAADPGLIYDADVTDYMNFLCTLNYTEQQLRTIVNSPISCLGIEGSPRNLNYPSFSVVFDNQNKVQVLNRTVTNVGELPETYTVRVINPRPQKLEISVKPESLTFLKIYEKRSYTVEFKTNFVSTSGGDNSTDIVAEMEFGYIIWESDQHSVKSPVSIMWTNTQA